MPGTTARSKRTVGYRPDLAQFAPRSGAGLLNPSAPLPRVVAATGPTISLSTTAPTLTGYTTLTPKPAQIAPASIPTWAASTVYSGGVVANTPGGTLVRVTGGTSSATWAADAGNWTPPGAFATFIAGGNFHNQNGANGWTCTSVYPNTYGTRSPYAVMFGFDGLKCALRVTSAPGHVYRVSVDGQYIGSTNSTTGLQNGATAFLTIDFTTLGAAPRVIKVEMVFGDTWGIYTAPTDTVWAVAPRGPRVISIGDSYGGGASAYNGITSFVTSMGAILGWDDVWNSHIGGSGYLQSGNNSLNSRYQQDLIAMKPDVVICSYGHNDNPAYTPAQLAAVVTTVVTAIKAALPKCIVIITGPLFVGSSGGGNPAPSGTWVPYEGPILAAAAAAGALTVPTVARQIFQGTGTVASTTGIGNGDKYVQADNVHPTQLGADYLGYRMAQAVLETLRAQFS